MLRDEIISTLAYYSVFDMPLSSEEIFRYLIRKESSHFPSLKDVEKELALLPVKNREGYYFFLDREYLVPLRKKRETIAEEKWRKTMRAVRWLSIVPFVQVIFASGSLALRNTNELSDLDILLIVRHGRIWLTRFLVNAMLSILRVRRKHEDAVAPDKVCPNHFVTDESLRIDFQNMYTAQLYANLVPLMITDKDLPQKFQIANEWVFKYLHHWQMPESPKENKNIIRKIGEFLLDGRVGDFFENRARAYQKKRILGRNVHVAPGGHLRYTDQELAFHSDTSAQKILERFELNLTKL